GRKVQRRINQQYGKINGDKSLILPDVIDDVDGEKQQIKYGGVTQTDIVIGRIKGVNERSHHDNRQHKRRYIQYPPGLIIGNGQQTGIKHQQVNKQPVVIGRTVAQQKRAGKTADQCNNRQFLLVIQQRQRHRKNGDYDHYTQRCKLRKQVKLLESQRYAEIKNSNTTARQHRTKGLVTVAQPMRQAHQYGPAKNTDPHPANR